MWRDLKKGTDTFRAKGPVEKKNRDIEGMLAKCFQAKSTIGWIEGPYFLFKSRRTEVIMETLIVEHVRQYFESL